MDMKQSTSLVDLLQERALEQALETAYTFLADGEREEARLTFAELDRRARAIAAVLTERGARDERVLLLFLPGLDFIAGFFGCLYARAVAVPTYPPRMQKGNSRLDAILASARPAVVLTTSALLARREAVCLESPALADLPWIAIDQVEDAAAEVWQRPSGVDAGTVAFLQYTSGSTSVPKGVMVSHGNLLANEEMIRRSCRHDERSDFVSWLPMYHDMGLIGSVLQPLYLASSCVLMAPVAFLQRPMRWLRAISHYRAHTSGAPNFAYDLCVRKSTPEERAELDLSSWRIAFNGAEPVRRDTLELFAEAFAPAGFRPETFFPCYGLAEATLIVSGIRRDAPAGAAGGMTVRGRDLDAHRVVAAAEEESGARSLVSCGPTILDEQVAIVHPESRRRCAPDEVGEIWVAGDHVAQGYWKLPEVSEVVFRARIEGEGDREYLRTGDLGFFAAGELYVTGRIKDLVILRGVNHYPQDLELTVEQQHSALRPGCAAAFAVEAGGEERLVVVQEVDIRKAQDWQEILRSILRALAEEHEVQPYAVVLTRPGVVPKTSSGKVQRFACRQKFLEGIPQTVAEVRFDQGAEAAAEAPAADLDVAAWLADRIARRLGVEPGEVRADEPLARFGLDSLAAIELAHDLETRLGVSLSLPDLLESTLADLAAMSPGALSTAASAEAPETVMPLSRGQKALWFLSREEPESPARNIVGAARISAGLDTEALRRAFQALVDRHPGLRTVFTVREGEPEQRVLESSALDFQAWDAADWSEEELRARLDEEAFRPFDLEAGPLLRVRLAQGILLLAVHHLVADFWSMAVLLDELRALLSSRELPAAAGGYGSFIRDQERLLAGPQGEALESYWLDQLAGAPAALDLIPDRPRRERRSGLGAARHFRVDETVTARLRELGGRSAATLFTTLLGAWQALLLRTTGQEDVAVGAPWAGRSRAGLASVVGYFVNPLVLRSDLSGDPSFSALLERVRGTVLGAFEHAELPFPLLVERLAPERLPGRTPFLEVTFAFQKPPSMADPSLSAFALGRPGHSLSLGGLTLESLDLPRRPLPFELSLLIGELDGGLAGVLEYDPDLFDASTMDRMGEHLRVLLEAVSEDPGIRVWDLPLMAAGERLQTVAEPPLAQDLSVHERFEARAAEAPDAVALVSASSTLTYSELDLRADRLARRLRAMGVGPETLVALFCDRSVEMVVGALAVLKAGGAYVPLDPATPPSRLSWLLEDTAAPVLLTRSHLATTLPPHDARTVLLDAETEDFGGSLPAGEPGRTAYVIYTSGSTGRPKGVAVTHAGLSNLARWHEAAFEVTADDRASHLAGLGFDAAVWELWPYLAAGAAVHLTPEEVRGSAEALWSWLTAEGITLAFLPTPLAEAVLALDSRPAARLRLLLTGGDRLRTRPRSTESFLLFNNYGPTESTVVTTSGVVSPGPDSGLPSIGRPIAGLQVRLLQRWSLAPAGLPGELCVAGVGLARGYLGRPDLTAERFVPDPFSPEPGSRMYRTGDLCRQEPDGEIEFLGRLDSQIKLRGFRIEPGEIEAALKSHPAVSEAAVALHDGVLVAWAAAPSGAAAGELRRFLETELPGHMVPAVFVVLGELPLLPSGKIDRRSLPAPERPAATDGAPGTPTEELVAGIWAQALGLPRVGVRDDLFALGGHSLLAAKIASRLGELFEMEIPVRALFEEPTVAALARRIDQARRTAPSPLRPADRSRPLQPSFSQERLWFLEQVRPETSLYNIPAALVLRGQLREEPLRAALAEVARRHEALRTTFAVTGGQPVLVVHPSAESFALPVVDLSGLPDSDAEAERLAREEAWRSFDLESGPLARATLLRVAPDERRVLLTLHHIVADGWSTDVLLREVAELYRAFLEGRPSPLPELRFQFADVAARQREELSSEALVEPLAWWRERLAGVPATLDLPLDRPRPALQGDRGATVRHTLSAKLQRELAGLGRHSGATLFMVLLAGFEALLSRVSGQDRMVVGSPVAGRNRPETEGLIGFFVNTLALPGDISGDPEVEALLGRVREIALGAYSRQEVPFERLVEELRPERSLALAPLFQVVLALQGRPAPVELPGVELEVREGETGTAKFDLTLSFRETGEGLAGSWELALDLFDRTTVARLARQFETLLAGMAASPALRVSELPVLSETERHQLGAEWNDARTDFPRQRTVHELAAEQALRTPDSRVEYGEESLTFRELDREANRLAHHLRFLGVERGVPVALFLEPSMRFVLGSLAILKAGGAYVPLDGSYPRERLAFMLADVGAPLLLTEEQLLERLPASGARVLCLDDREAWAGEKDDDPAAGATADDLAYVIYTSGSTGVPKGVAVPHQAIVRLVRDTNYIALGPDDVIAQVSNTSFDAATFELWGALLNGARLSGIAKDVLLSPRRLAAELRATGATAMFMTSALFNQACLEVPDAFASMRLLMVGGEALDPARIREALAAGPPERLLNGYGPTESTTFAAWHPVRHVPEGSLSIPIGRPLANTRLHVLDRDLRPVPVGVLGELYLGGEGLAQGYIRRPELTADRFVPDPFAGRLREAGGRLYRTGDLARVLPDGSVDYLGRMDGQVKLRGFRIELGEIEAALTGHPGVREAAVVVPVEGEKRLVAYLAAEDGAALSAAGLRDALGRRLPEPMIPSAFVFLDRLPLTPNGKVDRKALARLSPVGQGEEAREEAQPRTPVEEVLAGLWAQMLGVNRVGVHDDFFELGGHSLLATRLVSRVREVLGVELPVRHVFESPTVAGLAARIESAAFAGGSIPRLPQEAARPLSFGQHRLWFLDQLEPGSAFYNLPAALRLCGRLDLPALEAALGEVARRHDVLRTVFPAKDGQPSPVVLPFAGMTLPRVDLAGLSREEDRRAELERLAADDAHRPFDLARGPLLRGCLVRLGEDGHALLLNLHHIAGDGWSVGLFARELGELYGAFVQGLPSPLPELPIQYEDFAAWQRERLSGGALAEQIAWWRERLEGVPPLELPTDRPRPAVPSHRGATERVAIPAELTRSLVSLGAREGATLFMTLLAGFGAVLGRYAGQELFAVGSPIAGRGRAETEGLIGFFVNTLVLRCDLSGDPMVRELIARVRETCLGAYAHQETPFERLVEELRPERDLSRSPLFQVMLGVQEEAAPVSMPGLEAEWMEGDGGTARFDLTLSLTRSGESLAGLAEMATDLFDPDTVRGLLRHLRVLLEAAAADAGRRVSDLPLMEEPERRQVLVDWNRTELPFTREATLHGLVAAQAERTPDAVALVAGEERLTYGDLWRRASALADHLRRLGVGPEVRVGICARRSPELVAGILGVLAAGGAYVPLDPDYPASRLAFSLEDAAVPVLLTQSSLIETLPLFAGRVLLLDPSEDLFRMPAAPVPGEAAGPGNVAYVIYTSGSTGRPKGVEIEHRSAVAMVRWAQETFPRAALEGMLFSTSVCFDLSVFELFVPLSLGGKVVLAGGALDLPELAAAGEVTMINTVPSAISELLRVDAVPPSARVVNLAGEPLRAGLVESLERLGTVEAVYNLYGPTEDTTYSTWARFPAGSPRGEGWTPPIGRPIANTRAYLVDRRLQPVPVGVPGELLLAGDGLARGYLGRPDVTAERFIPDPFAAEPGERLYRTGDLCRYRPDGQLHFLGRLDHQVKIRGFRIEPGEIEAALAAQPGVREAVVLVLQDSVAGPRLVAYMEGTPAPSLELRRALEQRLPSYMIPSAFVALDAFPRTPNGKVDRRSLPVPGAPRSERPYIAPRTPVEETLAGIWRSILGVEQVGVHDDFFHLGGHSLLGTQVISRIRDAFRIPDLPLRALFLSPTVADLALLITQQQADAVDSHEMDELLTELESLSPAELARWIQEETQGEP